MFIFIFILYILFITFILYKLKICISNRTNKKQIIIELTDKWLHNVSVEKNVENLYNMFYKKQNMITKKNNHEDHDLKKHLNFFINLPKIKILSKEYNISQVSENIYINTVYTKWTLRNKEPIEFKIIFIFKNNYIFELHSSTI